MQKIHLENQNFMGFKDFAVHNLRFSVVPLIPKQTFLNKILA